VSKIVVEDIVGDIHLVKNITSAVKIFVKSFIITSVMIIVNALGWRDKVLISVV